MYMSVLPACTYVDHVQVVLKGLKRATWLEWSYVWF